MSQQAQRAILHFAQAREGKAGENEMQNYYFFLCRGCDRWGQKCDAG